MSKNFIIDKMIVYLTFGITMLFSILITFNIANMRSSLGKI